MSERNQHNEPGENASGDNDETRAFDPSLHIGQRADDTAQDDSTLFEYYERRSLRTIIEQQRAYRESQAAQAARAILDGAVLPEFDPHRDEAIVYEDFENENEDDSGPRFRRIRVQRVGGVGRLASPGAQIVYVLLVIAALGGTLGLAFSTNSPHLLLIAGIATPMLLPICVWRWISWLDSAPYYYRLLTTLGEDARNLLAYRLLWKKSSRG